MAKKIIIHISKKKGKRRVKITILILILILCLLQGIELGIKNELSIKDFEYAYTVTQIKKQLAENAILHEEVLRDEALTTILVKAEKEDFISARIIY